MNKIAIVVFLTSAVLAAAVPQGYKYQAQPLQLGKQTFNLRPQTPVSSSGIYSVQQAPALTQITVQSQQQQQQPIQVAPQQTVVNTFQPLPQVQQVHQIQEQPIQHVQHVQQIQQQPIQQVQHVQQVQQPIQHIQQIQQPIQQVYQQPQQIVQTQQVQTQYVQRPSIITKDIYIHSAPEETEEISQSAPQLDNLPVRKNYRIVFIKAPSQNIKYTAAALKRAQATNEEKTVIYVLSKKPDISEIQQQLQVTQTEAKVHKPEVYFIKYKTQEEAHRAQQEIQAQYDALGGATHISDEGVAPLHTVTGGSLNLGQLVPHHIQSQALLQPQQIQTQTIVQPQIQSQTSFKTQTSSLGSSINFGSNLSEKYIPAKTFK